mgnify:CR=1 FL=1
MAAVGVLEILIVLIVAASGADIGQARAPSAADIMPQGCFAFVELRPVPKWDAIMKSVSNKKMADHVRTMKGQMLGKLARGLQCEPQELEALFDKVDGAAFGMWELAREKPKFAVVITFETAGDAKRLSDLLAGKAVRTMPTPWGTQHAYRDGLFIGHAERRIILAPGPGEMDTEALDAVGSLTMSPGGGLTDNPEFMAVRDRVQADRPAVGYLNARRLINQMHSGAPEFQQRELALIDQLFDLQNVGGAMLGLRRDGNLIMADVVADAPGNRVYAMVQGPPQHVDVLNYCPAGSVLAAAADVPQLADRWGQVNAYIEGLTGGQWSENRRKMKNQIGIAPDEELMELLTGDIGYAIRGADGGGSGLDLMNMAFLLGFRTSEDARTTMDTLKSKTLPNQQFQQKQVGPATLVWTSAKNMAYAIHEGMLITGPSPGPVEASIKAGTSAKNVSSAGVQGRLLSALPDRASGKAVLDLMAVTRGQLRMLPGQPENLWVAAAILLPEQGPHAQVLLHAPLMEN